jgi:serpin B
VRPGNARKRAAHGARFAPVRATRGVLGALLAVGYAACSEGPVEPGTPQPITELPRALSTLESRVLRASNAFAFSFAGELLPDGNDNLFYSPLSASMLLGMVLNGADGRTYEQMRSVLALDGLSQEEINRGYADLTDLLLGLDPAVTVDVGSSVWTKQGFPVTPDFMSRVRDSFDAAAETVDFGNPATLGRINDWASESTQGRIEKIFDQLPGNVVMVLLNAIYFKADWTQRFERARTERAPFTRPDGSQVAADLMYLEGELRGRQGDGATLVELPYGGGAFTMVVALPDPGTTANELARNLTAETWNRWMNETSTGPAILRLPRFQLEWEMRLNEPLQRLGMTDAFEAGLADFRRMTPGGGVWLDLVKQKSFVKVDEEGTEAAAVTGAVVVESAPMELRVDRPFLFAIRERLTGTVLFLGIVNDPTG